MSEDKKKRLSLGKGLASLLADAELPQSAREEAISNEIPISEIETNPFQPRTAFDEGALRELADSIRIHGIIQPITVRKLATSQYQLISGERRWRAAQIAGLTTIPAYVRTADDQQMLEMAIIENIQRQDLNHIEVALSYQRLLDECGITQADLGTRMGKSREAVTNQLRLLRLPPDIQAAIKTSKLSLGHAKVLLGIDKTEVQLAVFRKAVSEEMTVRALEQLVRSMAKSKTAPTTPAPDPEDEAARFELRQIQQKLASRFGTKVEIKSVGKGKGEIAIPYQDTDDLNRLLQLLGY